MGESGKSAEELEKMLVEERLKNRMAKDRLKELKKAITKIINLEIAKL